MKQIKPIVVPATEEHCIKLSKAMRDIDRRELWATSGLLPIDGLVFSFETSRMSYAVIDEETEDPIMIFGVSEPTTLFSRRCQIWMLATDDIYNISITFLRQCKSYIDAMGAGYVVYNYVIEGNNKTLKWLQWLGFTILKAKPQGLLGQNFHYIEKDITLCAASASQQLH